MNGVSLSRNFFHVYTIDYGLSSRAIESASSSIFFALHPLPAREDMFGQIRQFSHISEGDSVGASLIWKSTSSYIENCFQKFVRSKIGSKRFFGERCHFCKVHVIQTSNDAFLSMFLLHDSIEQILLIQKNDFFALPKKIFGSKRTPTDMTMNLTPQE
jgi:hypothetical protein